jgi:hypothetical protein
MAMMLIASIQSVHPKGQVTSSAIGEPSGAA